MLILGHEDSSFSINLLPEFFLFFYLLRRNSLRFSSRVFFWPGKSKALSLDLNSPNLSRRTEIMTILSKEKGDE